jgi:hypothetical protein
MGQGEPLRGRSNARVLTVSAAKYDLRLIARHLLTEYSVMERDRRLTGFFRGQSDRPVAPKGFEMSAGWKVVSPAVVSERLANASRLNNGYGN